MCERESRGRGEERWKEGGIVSVISVLLALVL